MKFASKNATFRLAALAVAWSAISFCPAQAQQATWTRQVREAVANGQAQRVGRLPAAQPMRLVLVLPLRDQAGLDEFLRQLYDPQSRSYRQFLSVEAFTERFGPTEDDYNAVIGFAKANGFTVAASSRNRLNLDVTGPVASVEKAFHVTMGIYRHATENRTFYAPDREPTPDLAVRLWHIAGLDDYSIPRPLLVRRPAGVQPNAMTGSCPDTAFCGSDMRAAYYYQGTLTGSGQSVGLLEFAGTDLADLETYYANAGQTNTVPITLLSTDGTSTKCVYSQGCDDTEQTVDMTQALGMAPGMSGLVMYVGSTDAAIFNAMATHSPLNAQLSSSWSWKPADPSTDNPYFEEFAAQGQNLFQAAGDSGAWQPSSEVWPADDPYLTSVGGTDLVTAGPAGPWLSETAWSGGGGGISPDKFAIPAWQAPAASGCASCSKTYRNAPDVAANANYSFYVCADQTTCSANAYGGTSFAAPMWAGFLALVNQQEMAHSGHTLGFINPALYTIGLTSEYDTDFHDITSGSNGQSAAVGYDLATGWGSPNGLGLVNALAPSAIDGIFSFTGSLNDGRNSQTVTPLPNGTILVTGGYGNASHDRALASAEVYTPATGSFALTGSMNTARAWDTATLLPSGMVLIAGGFNGTASLNSAELYNPATGTFAATGNLNTARYGHTATLLLNGMVLIAGGYDYGTGTLASAELYNPSTGTFTLTGSLNTARYDQTATMLPNGMVLMAGGCNSACLASAELYEPASGTFVKTGSMSVARVGQTATLLPSGLVLIAGGADGKSLASAELYDPAAHKFAATGSMNAAREHHTATLLNTGSVLVAGGEQSTGALASAELYDPATGTFILTGNLNVAGYDQAAALLQSGLALVTGGLNGSSEASLTSAELFQ